MSEEEGTNESDPTPEKNDGDQTIPMGNFPVDPDAPTEFDPKRAFEMGTESDVPSSWAPPSPKDIDPLFPDYEIIELIGRGGMGAVYKGEQKSLKRAVAIKLLPPEMADADPSFAERFKNEARAMAQLDHPNIVHVYDFGQTEEGHWFIVMEFVDGTDFHHLIQSGELDPQKALQAVSQICDALDYAHEQGYVHRDIKPANIFINQKGVLKVGDFGLAKLIEGDDEKKDAAMLTMTGYSVGTPAYCAPEQLTGGAVDQRADIYSLGVMFYEMLTGQVPRGHFALPSEKVQIDIRLDDVVLKAMADDPERRYQKASEVRTEIDTIREKRNGEEQKMDSPQGKAFWARSAFVILVVALLSLTYGLWSAKLQRGKSILPVSPIAAPEGAKSIQGIEKDIGNTIKRDLVKLGEFEGQEPGEEIENSIEMKLCWIPAGKFTMGSPENEEGRNAEREAQVKVELTRGFWIGKYEVTQGEYLEVTGSNPAKFKEVGKKAPVDSVNWQDAMDFCEKLTERERKKGTLASEWIYTLPTEAQREYASRAGEKGPHSGGKLEEVGWFLRNAGGKTHPVGEKKPNAWGLHDVHGNVWEWSRDWFTEKLSGGKDPKGPDTGAAWVPRGGSWISPADLCRSASRGKDMPGDRRGTLGFRVAMVHSGKENDTVPHWIGSTQFREGYLEEFGFEHLANLPPSYENRFEGIEVKQGNRTVKDGVLTIQHFTGMNASHNHVCSEGIIVLEGRVVAGTNTSWILCLTNPVSQRGIQIMVKGTGEILFASSMFQPVNKQQSKTIHKMSMEEVLEYHTIGLLIGKESCRVFLDGEPISKVIPLNFSTSKCNLGIGAGGLGKLQFNRVSYWKAEK